MTDSNSSDLLQVEPATEAVSADTGVSDTSVSDTNHDAPGADALDPLADTSTGVSQGAIAALNAVYECTDAAERAGAVIDFCADYEPNDQLYGDLLSHKAALALYLAIANRIDAGGDVMPILQAALDAIHAQDAVEAAINADILSRPLDAATPDEQAAHSYAQSNAQQ